jgi:uncharacterized protein YdeI (YjbR/CyaY-like superfamily)
MPRDPWVDAYIERAQPFARPILTRLRELVHTYLPEATEAKKWSSPSFLYKGRIIAGMAAFKAHATFGLWHGDATEKDRDGAMDAMGNFGKLRSLDDLPAEGDFAKLLASAVIAMDSGVKPERKHGLKPSPPMHPAFAAALAENPAAQATLDGFPPSAQREYLEWVYEAKQEATRQKRIAQAVEWLAEGKRRHWKYQDC